MDECIVCGNKALYACKPCKVSFCEEHKLLHEKTKNKVHIFEKFVIKLESSQTARIIENLLLKINKVKEFEERIILGTSILIQQIEELCVNCLQRAKYIIQHYINHLKIIQSQKKEQDFKIIEDQLNVCLSLNIPTPNFQEIRKFYDFQFFPESPSLGEFQNTPLHNPKKDHHGQEPSKVYNFAIHKQRIH